MIGELLFQITRQEARSAPVMQRFWTRGTNAVANVQVIASLPSVPMDKVFLITSLNVLLIAGAAQTVSTWQVYPNVPGLIFDDSGTLAAVQRQAFRWIGAPVATLMPGENLQVEGNFNAGAAVNTSQIFAQGYLIPKGTLQLR